MPAVRVSFAVLTLLMPAAAAAAVTQPPPGNESLPQTPTQAELLVVTGRGFSADADTLGGLFRTFGGGADLALDPAADASTTPGSFLPQCGLTASVVLHGSSCRNALGWYNATEPATVPAAIYSLIPANLQAVYPDGISCMDADFCPLATRTTTQVGAHVWADPLPEFAVQIRTSPNWAGGPVGFALVGAAGTACPQTKYSQAALNDKSPSGAPWVTALAYHSVAQRDAYYLAFEGLPTCATSWKGCGAGLNDGDFNDAVFYVRGVACRAAGASCAVTGKMGICAAGITDCAVGDAVVCRQTVSPSTETCNGVDDDCNGLVDEGTLCPTGEACAGGRCTPACNKAGFVCATGLACGADARCRDPRCIGVACLGGSVCVAGDCVAGGCGSVACPLGQVCRLGSCVDPCVGVTCPNDRVCEGGVCQPLCGTCRACGTGKTCAVSGSCVDSGCEAKTCPSGQVCVGGFCTDGCTGAVCPVGLYCKGGTCLPVALVPKPDGGTDAAPDSGGAVDGGLDVAPDSTGGVDAPTDSTGNAGATGAGGRGGASGTAGAAGASGAGGASGAAGSSGASGTSGAAGSSGGGAGAAGRGGAAGLDGGGAGGSVGGAGGRGSDASTDHRPASGGGGCGCDVSGSTAGAAWLVAFAAFGLALSRRKKTPASLTARRGRDVRL